MRNNKSSNCTTTCASNFYTCGYHTYWQNYEVNFMISLCVHCYLYGRKQINYIIMNIKLEVCSADIKHLIRKGYKRYEKRSINTVQLF